MRRLLTISALIASTVLSTAEAGILYHWIQLVPEPNYESVFRNNDADPPASFRSDAMVRAIVTSTDSCPELRGSGVAMQLYETLREKPNDVSFYKIKLCELRIPSSNFLVHQFTPVKITINSCITNSNNGTCSVSTTLPNLSFGIPLTKMVFFGCSGCRSEKEEIAEIKDKDKEKDKDKDKNKDKEKDKNEAKNKNKSEDENDHEHCKLPKHPKCKINEDLVINPSPFPEVEGQYCSAEKWPFSTVIADAKQVSSGKIPPVVVHLGDVRYSQQKEAEDSWSVDNPGDESWRYNETPIGWKEEFFDPTSPLLQEGYWLMLRGNHEACLSPELNNGDKLKGWYHKDKKDKDDKGKIKAVIDLKDRGKGWFYFFSNSESKDCNSITKGFFDKSYEKDLPYGKDIDFPYALDATVYHDNAALAGETYRLLIMDTVRTGDDRDQLCHETKSLYQQQFSLMEKAYRNPTKIDSSRILLLSHMPLYVTKKGKLEDTILLDALYDSNLFPSLDRGLMAIASHRHQFQLHQSLPDDHNKISHYVIGNSGIALSPLKEFNVQNLSFCWSPVVADETKTLDALVMQESKFGYLMAEFNIYGQAIFRPRFVQNINSNTLEAADRATCQTTPDGLYCLGGEPVKR
ncbi:MAG: hypothetical protein G8345_11055 [Magnetococcales bacterium]|nr:hypothetical protein [Magnetococcales bacterium]NGZ27411.1 hypothetical protein [Magnetococcales bacterium]